MKVSNVLMCAAALGLGRSASGLGTRPAQPPTSRRSKLSEKELIAGGRDADEEDDFDTWFFEHAEQVLDDDEDTVGNPAWHRASLEETSAVGQALQQCRLPSEGKPSLQNGVIAYLVTRPMDLIRLKESVPRLRYYFLRHWTYPVKIFIPGDELRKYDWLSYMDSPKHDEVHETMRKFGGSGYDWEIVSFDLKFPKAISRDDAWTIKMNSCAKAVDTSYKHMNQFFTKAMYEHPALSKYKYYLRIDADFNFKADLAQDPFCMMAETGRKFMWQTRKEIMDPSCSEGLWEWFLEYQQAHGLTPHDDIFWQAAGARVNYVGYINMGDLDFFRSKQVSRLAEALNEDGRVYLNRWSDQTYFPLLFALFENHTAVGDIGFGWPAQAWAHKGYIPPKSFNPDTGTVR